MKNLWVYSVCYLDLRVKSWTGIRLFTIGFGPLTLVFLVLTLWNIEITCMEKRQPFLATWDFFFDSFFSSLHTLFTKYHLKNKKKTISTKLILNLLHMHLCCCFFLPSIRSTQLNALKLPANFEIVSVKIYNLHCHFCRFFEVSYHFMYSLSQFTTKA